MTAILHLTDSATGKKAPFHPVDPTAIGLYVCGPTVYDRAHIGNARSAVVFDMVFRMLGRVFGPEAVTYVRNFTDIDDKIINRATQIYPQMQPLEAIAQLTRETTRWYHRDMDALGVLRPTHEPRATAYVDKMIEDIQAMIVRGAGPMRLRVMSSSPHRPIPIAGHSLGGAISTTPRSTVSSQTLSNAIRQILYSGSLRPRTSPDGKAPGGLGGPAGTSNARPCPHACSDKALTSTAVDRT